MFLCPFNFICCFFFFFNDTATTEIYTLSLHDALPICPEVSARANGLAARLAGQHDEVGFGAGFGAERSEEHTSELQSRSDLVCRLLLEKKKKNQNAIYNAKTKKTKKQKK